MHVQSVELHTIGTQSAHHRNTECTPAEHRVHTIGTQSAHHRNTEHHTRAQCWTWLYWSSHMSIQHCTLAQYRTPHSTRRQIV
eukprot:3800631-Rhodomonas_salina.1